MDNYQIAENFSLLSKLMDIHGENSFKAKTYAIAAYHVENLTEQLSNTPVEKIPVIKGIGESTGKKIIELLETGELKVLQEMISKTPPGVIELLNIKGIGPKKIHTIWKEMEIESIGELLYACQENRLKLYKGFGEKTQQNIIETIEYYLHNQGSYLYPQVEAVVPQIIAYLEKLFSPENVFITGAFKRQVEIIDELEFVVNSTNELIKPKFVSANPPELLEEKPDSLLYKLLNGLRLRLYTGTANFQQRIFATSGSAEFTAVFEEQFPSIDYSKGEKAIFEQAKISFIPPCLRETAAIIEKAKAITIPDLIQPGDIKGIIHSHSNWSDGSYTLEEMAKAAKEKGFEYLVISDHSKSAFYAQGLNEERIAAQQQYVNELNDKITGFKIFKSIECDILNDGSLDYTNTILSTFDLVIVSVHSNLKMSEEKAMLRLLNAIENPYTTILGHMTGRLLLSRKGYPVDHKKIIDACAANHVAIELNAHPSRLDIDWRHIDYALQKNVLISIDPDAHTIEGFDDIRYGVLAAQKAMVTKEQNLSSFGLKEFESYLEKVRGLKGLR
ncbi:helix-hairpin-helix domain-containing protein [Ferruginibacter sp. SUN106]|uniref:helix-hairpin-helix domain-containing protein n=1 Tax=Ferruginibacter sp. SUN106 TaxID=2978348 RepID=UPI003D3688A1